MADEKKPKRIPVSEDLLTAPLDRLEDVRLKGTRCRKCNEVFFGRTSACENCCSEDVEEITLSNRGKLYTYTIIENPPPGDYKGPKDPFVPFGEGLVELPEGVRVIAPLTVNKNEDIQIGMDLELVVYKLYDDEDGNEVFAFKFKPV